MKYEKAREIVEKHPWLKKASFLDCMGFGSVKNRQFIEEKIEFIAFRPFERLELDFAQDSKGTTVFDKYTIYRTISPCLYYHFKGEESFSRDVGLVDAPWKEEGAYWTDTIRRQIRIAKYIGDKESKHVVFDAAIKSIWFGYGSFEEMRRLGFGGNHMYEPKSSEQGRYKADGILSISYEVYLFPPNWTPEDIKNTRTERRKKSPK